MLSTPGVILHLVEYGTLSDANRSRHSVQFRTNYCDIETCGGGQKQINIKI